MIDWWCTNVNPGENRYTQIVKAKWYLLPLPTICFWKIRTNYILLDKRKKTLLESYKNLKKIDPFKDTHEHLHLSLSTLLLDQYDCLLAIWRV